MATLLGRLMARPPADLPALAVAWGARLPGRGHAEDVVALYRAMTDGWALRDVLEGLSAPAARRLWRLARDGAVGDTAADAAGADSELLAVGLLHPVGDSVGGPAILADETAARLRRLAEERRAGDRVAWPLPDLLAALDGGELAAAVERWTGSTAGPPRAETEAALLAAVAEPLALDDIVAGLDRVERALFDRLERAGRPLLMADVRRWAGLPPPVLRRALRHLHEALLVWERWADRRRWLFVPAELRRSLVVAPRRPFAAAPAGWRHPLALAWDVLAALRRPDLVRPVGAATAWPATYPLWGTADGRTTPAYRRFLGAAAAAVAADGSADAWVAQSLLEQQRTLVDWWCDSATPWPTDAGPVVPRAALLAALANLTPAEWYPLDAVATVVGRGETTASPARASGRAAVTALRTVLPWLGLVEPGHERDGPRQAVRLSQFGAWRLAGGPPPDTDAADIVVEPSLRILVYAADAALLWALLAFADPEQLDRVSVFRLTREGALRGQSLGLTATDMVVTLMRASRHTLPQNVAYALQDWTRVPFAARVERVLLLTFDDARARDAALAQPRLRQLGAEALASHLARVPAPDDAAEAEVRATLRALGLAD